MRVFVCIIVGMALCGTGSLLAEELIIEMVDVGDPGNQPHPESALGAVSYPFRIGKYEITCAQYVAFLNAVASSSDPFGLFNPIMATSIRGGVLRSGNEGAYQYAVKEGMEDHPMGFLSWYHAARFVNWMHHGQGSGDTETGAYHLQGATNGVFAREEGAKYWLPSVNEWYKAAYYDPEKDGSGGYWLFATRSDKPPLARSPNTTDSNSANLNSWARPPELATPVGAYPAAQSAYGTCDQAGNLLEYTEAFASRGSLVVETWGGNYAFGPSYTAAHGSTANPHFVYPSSRNDSVTFRIAGKIEP